MPFFVSILRSCCKGSSNPKFRRLRSLATTCHTSRVPCGRIPEDHWPGTVNLPPKWRETMAKTKTNPTARSNQTSLWNRERKSWTKQFAMATQTSHNLQQIRLRSVTLSLQQGNILSMISRVPRDCALKKLVNMIESLVSLPSGQLVHGLGSFFRSNINPIVVNKSCFKSSGSPFAQLPALIGVVMEQEVPRIRMEG